MKTLYKKISILDREKLTASSIDWKKKSLIANQFELDFNYVKKYNSNKIPQCHFYKIVNKEF
jgi:hypothetical protein